jgi:phosphoglycolate phosphatase-like HAD superfamily hydrolase
MENKLTLSTLGHTWLLDLDGTIVKHNGYKIDGQDSLLDGAKEFLESIPEGDKIIFLTSRKTEYKEQTEGFLKENSIRYDEILFDLPYGERVLLNDKKESGLVTGIAVNKERDTKQFPVVALDAKM